MSPKPSVVKVSSARYTAEPRSTNTPSAMNAADQTQLHSPIMVSAHRLADSTMTNILRQCGSAVSQRWALRSAPFRQIQAERAQHDGGQRQRRAKGDL